MNRVQLVGRTTKNISIEKTNDSVYAKFTLAINEGKDRNGNERATFVPVTAWGKVAEGLVKYVGKGSLVAVEGRISASHKNEKMYIGVVATRVEYLATKKPGETTAVKEHAFAEEDIQF